MRFLSLYSGIGLHDLGLTWAGIDIVGQVEIEPFCRAVLKKHWPGIPQWSDVCDVTTDTVRQHCFPLDGITGGFSCQDISIAGRGAGLGRETRSGLTWREMFRLIRGIRPNWLILENVPRLRTLGADRVFAALERISYACWPLVVGADAAGARMFRRRVWIIGFLVRPGGAGLEGAQRMGLDQKENGAGKWSQQLQSLRSMPVAWPVGPDRIGEIPLETDGRARGLAGFVRRESARALGNANPPQVAEMIGRAVMRMNEET